MATFTFITEYQGGTYISQQEADDLRSACYRWKEYAMSGGYIPNLDMAQFSKAFDSDVDELPPVAIDNVSSVWIFHLLIFDEMLTAHIILTDVSTHVEGVS